MTGEVVSLHRWPVKSMGGEALSALDLDGRGADGDRAYAVFDEFKGGPRRLTAREAPRLLLWSGAGGAVTAPDGTRFAYDDGALPAALAADLGRPVEVRHDPTLMQDLPDSLLITFGASHRAVEADMGGPLDPLRWRTNVHVEADAAAFEEVGWEGRTLVIGDAELELLHPCERCVIPTRDPHTAEKRPELLRYLNAERATLFGINARPAGPARIAIGDPVSLR
jgi:uncharacterized protein YcbX